MNLKGMSVGFLATGVLALSLALPGAQAREVSKSSQTMHKAAYQERNVQGYVPGAKLSASQRRQVESIREEARRDARAIERNPKLSAAQKQQRTDQIWRSAHDKVLNVMNRSQRQAFYSAAPTTQVAGYRGKPAVHKTQSTTKTKSTMQRGAKAPR